MYIIVENDLVILNTRSLDNLGPALQDKAIFVDGELPDVVDTPGTDPVLKYDGTKVYYDYVVRTLTREEQLLIDVKDLKEQNAQMLMTLVMGGLM